MPAVAQRRCRCAALLVATGGARPAAVAAALRVDAVGQVDCTPSTVVSGKERWWRAPVIDARGQRSFEVDPGRLDSAILRRIHREDETAT